MKLKRLFSILLATGLVMSMFAGCSSNPKPIKGEISNLVTYNSYRDLLKLFKAEDNNNYLYKMTERMAGDLAAEADEGSSKNVTQGSKDYSKTNVQVEGVDEADIVKTDGDYLYVLANGRFYIIDATQADDMKIVSQIEYTKSNDPDNTSIYPIEMFLDETNNKITIISNLSHNYLYNDKIGGMAMPEYNAKPEALSFLGYWFDAVSVQVLDVSDKAAPTVQREFAQDGTYLSSRRVGENVYLVTNKYVNYYEDEEGMVFPSTKDLLDDQEWETIPVDSIYVVEDSLYSNFVVISGINTVDSEKEASTKSILGAGSNLYATSENIYIANTRYDYDEANATSGYADEPVSSNSSNTKASLVDNVIRIFEPPVFTVFTDIFKFDISQGEVEPAFSGQVPGYILNQFAMDEYNNHLRIATTTGDTWREDEFTSMNNVYILNDSLEMVGKIEGLASTETIRSVRFMGDMAYMVTFRTTDPLFVLDLSQENNPKVKGELKIPGYSQYLHPISDTILVGFGRDAIEEDNRAIELGMKLSVFDVSDVNNPKEISVMKIGDSGTYSEVLDNHKALLYSKEKNILAFPITIYENITPNSNYWGYLPTFSGYMVVGLDQDNKLYEKGRISHYDTKIPDNLTNEKDIYSYYEKTLNYEYMYRVTRGMFIDDTLFTISDFQVKANSLVDYSDIGAIELPGFEEKYSYYFNGYKDIEPGQTDGDLGEEDNIIFTGTIKEVNSRSFLIEVNETEVGFDLATVGIEDMGKLDFVLQEGQNVKVEILPIILESYPVQVTGVNIWLTD